MEAASLSSGSLTHFATMIPNLTHFNTMIPSLTHSDTMIPKGGEEEMQGTGESPEYVSC